MCNPAYSVRRVRFGRGAAGSPTGGYGLPIPFFFGRFPNLPDTTGDNASVIDANGNEVLKQSYDKDRERYDSLISGADDGR